MIQLFLPKIEQEAISNICKVMESGWLGCGPKTKEFEDEFSQFIGCNYSVGLNAGTSALHLALILHGIEDGDEVITTPLTFISTNAAILYQRATPVFCDVDAATLCMDPGKIESLITEKTKAILVVHFGGHPCDMDQINNIAQRHGLVVIEDCAHACGSFYKGKRIGNTENTCCFSFQAVKNLPVGDGGMLTVNTKELDARARSLRWLGIDKDTFSRTEEQTKQYAWRYEVTELGYKYHMNDIAAAIGLAQLKVLDEHNARRTEIRDRYNELLPQALERPFVSDDVISSNHLYVIRSEHRNDLMSHLRSKQLYTGVHYIPNHLFNLFSPFRRKLEVCEAQWQKFISLPLHVNMTDDDIIEICDAIKEFYE